jgi:phasin family protein
MAKTSQPMQDWGKALASLDLTKGSEELLNMLTRLDVPGVNMDALVASQRENLEALSAANRAAVEGSKAVGEWQGKILKETMQALTDAMSARAKVTTPQQMLTTEAELAKKAFETAVNAMRELADIVTKANQSAIDAIIRRVPESLDDIKGVLKLPTPPKTS